MNGKRLTLYEAKRDNGLKSNKKESAFDQCINFNDNSKTLVV